ncbi:MAG TPA: Holliday junction resolvase RuvX [Bacteroidia bacterium]|nr:Holliday junction resolvase RuvX [Bacteroidia bacterium]
MGRVLGIDYGQKRTGLAVTDENQQFAFSLETVMTHHIFPYLNEYLLKNNVEGFVVGEPRRLNNTPTDATEFVEAFVRGLKNKFPAIPVHRVDERFTSGMARQAIIDSGIRKKGRQDKAMVDQVSATIILQSWLEQQQRKKTS